MSEADEDELHPEASVEVALKGRFLGFLGGFRAYD